jgi:hypothetical protein
VRSLSKSEFVFIISDWFERRCRFVGPQSSSHTGRPASKSPHLPDRTLCLVSLSLVFNCFPHGHARWHLIGPDFVQSQFATGDRYTALVAMSLKGRGRPPITSHVSLSIPGHPGCCCLPPAVGRACAGVRTSHTSLPTSNSSIGDKAEEFPNGTKRSLVTFIVRKVCFPVSPVPLCETSLERHRRTGAHWPPGRAVPRFSVIKRRIVSFHLRNARAPL